MWKVVNIIQMIKSEFVPCNILHLALLFPMNVHTRLLYAQH